MFIHILGSFQNQIWISNLTLFSQKILKHFLQTCETSSSSLKNLERPHLFNCLHYREKSKNPENQSNNFLFTLKNKVRMINRTFHWSKKLYISVQDFILKNLLPNFLFFRRFIKHDDGWWISSHLLWISKLCRSGSDIWKTIRWSGSWHLVVRGHTLRLALWNTSFRWRTRTHPISQNQV